MKEERFLRFERAVSDEFLEEAAARRFSRPVGLRFAAAAACLALLLGAALGYGRVRSGQRREVAAFAENGYAFTLPAGAQLLSQGAETQESGAVLAQACFRYEGNEYVCRALHSEAPTDLSDARESGTSELFWENTQLSCRLSTSGEESWLAWYEKDGGTQWCLGGADAPELVDTAEKLLVMLGLDMAVAPEGSREITYAAREVAGLTAAETTFVLDGRRWCYRVAATGDLSEDFADLSGQSGDYACQEKTELGWCPARLLYTPGGAGKLLWFDMVPGLVYSLSTDEAAGGEELLAMAERLYVPVQQDVG